MADFAFVYGKLEGDAHEINRQLFKSKTPKIELLDQKKLGTVRIRTLHDCIEYLRTTPPPKVQLPIGTLYLASHASSSQISMPMFRDQEGSTTYETLEDTIKVRDTNNPAPAERRIDMTPITLPDPSTHTVRVIGCNIGKAEPFVTKWKEALGGVTVIAPKHFDGVVPSDGYGVWEYLCYQFVLSSPKALSAKEMRAAFKAKAQTVPSPFLFIDGTAVPPEYFDDKRWYGTDLSNRNPLSTEMFLPASIGRASKTKRKETIWVARGLLSRKETLIIPVPYDAAADVPDPSDEDDCKASMKVSLQALPEDDRFKETHDFPMWERYGYGDIDEFIAGFTWHFEKGKTKNDPFVLVCTGRRATYTLVQPITDPNPAPDPKVGKVKANFHPKIGFDKIPSEPLPPDGLDLGDEDLFLTV
jgi:hypothetical protein